MSLKTICYITPEYYPHPGGVASISAAFTNFYRKNGHKVVTVTLNTPEEIIKQDTDHFTTRIGVNLLERYALKVARRLRFGEFLYWLIASYKTFFLVWRLHIKYKFDIIETHDYYSNSYYVGNFKGILKIIKSFIYIVRISGPLKVLEQEYYMNKKREKSVLLNFELKNIANADIVSYPSEIFKSKIQKLGVKIKKSIKLLPPLKEISLQDHKILEPKTFVYVGRIQDGKGVEDLVAAWVKIPVSIKGKAKLIIIGNDTIHPFQQSFKAYLENKYSLDNSIEFTGGLNHDQVNHYLKGSSAFVFPSRLENYPTVIIEAITAGCFIIGTEGTGVAECIRDLNYPNSLLIPIKNSEALAEAIIKVLNNKVIINPNNDINLNIRYWNNLIAQFYQELIPQ